MDERLEDIRWRLPGMTNALGAREFDDIVDEVIDQVCDETEMAVMNAEGALLATRALGRRAFIENSPTLFSKELF